MASSSTPPEDPNAYHLYAFNTNVSNFVSLKLSGYGNYHRWKTQMLCLIQAHDMCWLIDDAPKVYSSKIMNQYDSLLKGWIFGSVSDDVLGIVVDLSSAKDVWMKLKSCFDSTMSFKEDSTSTKIDRKTGTEDNMALGKSTTINKGTCLVKREVREEDIQTETKDSAASKVDTEKETEHEYAETETNKFRQLIADKNWFEEYFEPEDRNELAGKINTDGNTLIHIAIGMGRNEIIDSLISNLGDIDWTVIKNSDGSTVLHIAAIVGNAYAAMHLGSCVPGLLDIRDNEGKTPLDRAIENEHLLTIILLQNKTERTEMTILRRLIAAKNWFVLYLKLKERNLLTAKINSDGDRLLHIAVRIGDENLISKILVSIHEDDLTEKKNSDGSTALHIAAIVGNKKAAKLLVNKNTNLLYIKDQKGNTPLDKAYANGYRNVASLLAAAVEETNKLRKQIEDGDWRAVYLILKEKNALTEKINSYGETLLHKAVETSCNDLVKIILKRIREYDLTKIKNSDGSTVLHIAAIVGNTDGAVLLVKHDRLLLDTPDNEGKNTIVGNTNAAEILVNREEDLLYTKDNDGKTPLDKAYENMHLDTIAYLLEAEEASTFHPRWKKDADVEIGVDLLANAISAKRYDVALNLIGRYPEYAVFNDNVLMAMARTFPTGLDYGERLVYPNLDNTSERIVERTKKFFNSLVEQSSDLKEGMWSFLRCEDGFLRSVAQAFLVTIYVLLAMGIWIYKFTPLFLLMVYFPFFMIYLLLWKAAARVVPLVRNIEQKKKEYRKAKEVLELVLQTIIDERPDSSPDLYTAPILEAACQDAYEVVDQILGRWPEAIHCSDKNGYDIIQLATIHRSERVYNMIYIIGERKNTYRTIRDSSENNMLHLVGRLAPSNKLKRRAGAALQLQRELQWRQEVEKLVFPTFITKENIFMETPEMVFTKEHETLVKEGEKWIKTVAESCSITAALITTIVFAAAITVPGGSNQDTGIPVFTKKAAFTLFAIADAISLFTSATALLVFLSILTARFSEQDFLVRLPRRLIIGLCTLLISTTAMMVAFSATLFLVFSQQKLWVLAPICAFALLPIAFFFVLQFPLILDLIQSTYMFKFGKSEDESSKFAQNNIQFLFSK